MEERSNQEYTFEFSKNEIPVEKHAADNVWTKEIRRILSKSGKRTEEEIEALVENVNCEDISLETPKELQKRLKITRSEAEKLVSGYNSIEAAINYISSRCFFSKKEREYNINQNLRSCYIPDVKENEVRTLKEIFESKSKSLGSLEDMVLDMAYAIHDRWVQTNRSKFEDPARADKRYQHLNLYLIGWKEATYDLKYAEEIIKANGVNIDADKNWRIKIMNIYIRDADNYYRENRFNIKEILESHILTEANLCIQDEYGNPVIPRENRLIAKEMRKQVNDRYCNTRSILRGIDNDIMRERYAEYIRHTER